MFLYLHRSHNELGGAKDVERYLLSKGESIIKAEPCRYYK